MWKNAITYIEAVFVKTTALIMMLADIYNQPFWVTLNIFNPFTGIDMGNDSRLLHLLEFMLQRLFYFTSNFSTSQIFKADSGAYT